MIETTINDAVTMRGEATAGNARLRPGDEILGRYVVESELGQGGMGVVYKCLDKVGGVEVAVKGLPPEVSHNADEMEEIRDNYSLVEGLRHPNICGIKTLEKDERGDYYLVMDLARGVNLNRWLRQHPEATEAEKLSILRQIASALDYAHARKIIHRDVKPENVMVADDGTAQVLDFGLAAQVRSSLSRTSQAITSKSGTPGYKAPEQWLGQPQGAAADQYALGVIAYKLFAGRLPFDGDDLSVLGQAVLNAPVPKIAVASSAINAALAKALAKKTEDRFPSCAVFVAALISEVRVVTKRHLGKIFVGTVILALLAGGIFFYNHQTDVVESDGERPGGVVMDMKLPRGVKMEFVWCPPGSFMMGSPESEIGRDDNETPHSVTLTKGFWMGRYEVTQAQWQAVMGDNPSHFKGDDRPVDSVSWDDCQKFIEKCNMAAKGTRFALPTEAQWEYACRAGSTGPYAGTGYMGPMGWHGNKEGGTHPVGKKLPNAWNLYDMHGNVLEWCADRFGEYKGDSTDPTGPASGVDRVLRGGCWNFVARGCRSAVRNWSGPDYRNSIVGFRLLCSAGPHGK